MEVEGVPIVVGDATVAEGVAMLEEDKSLQLCIGAPTVESINLLVEVPPPLVEVPPLLVEVPLLEDVRPLLVEAAALLAIARCCLSA